MKKKLLLAGAMLLAAAAVTGFAAYDKSNVSDLLDANVEALARNEDPISCIWGWFEYDENGEIYRCCGCGNKCCE